MPFHIFRQERAHIGDFLRGGGGNGRGGFHAAVRGTMFVRKGAVTPGPSREFDITFFVKGRPKSTQQLRDSTVAVRRVQSVTVPSSRVTRKCRSPRLRSPHSKMPEHTSECAKWLSKRVFLESPFLLCSLTVSGV